MACDYLEYTTPERREVRCCNFLDERCPKKRGKGMVTAACWRNWGPAMSGDSPFKPVFDSIREHLNDPTF
jgi:hypothetical protein